MRITILTNWAIKLVALYDRRVILSSLREIIKTIRSRLFNARLI